jgi:colicin import membrane protein
VTRAAVDAGYRLAPLRDVRAREEQTQQLALAEVVQTATAAADALARADARLAQADAQLAAARAAATPPTTSQRASPAQLATPSSHASPSASATARPIAPPRTAAQLRAAEAYVARRHRDLLDARAARERAAAAAAAAALDVTDARVTLGTARAQRELLERHFARWRQARRQRADRREEP